jgi:ribosomal protein L24
MKQDLVEI